MQSVIDHIQAHRELIIEQITAATIATELPVYRELPPAQIRTMVANALAPLEDDLATNRTDAYSSYWRQVGPQRAQAGVAIGNLLGLIDRSFGIISASIRAAFVEDQAALVWWLTRMHELTYAGATALAETFVAAREQFIQAQTEELLAVSSPIIPISEGILVLPLLGRIDARRAKHVLEVVLEGITGAQADVVLVDVTGVPLVDTDVAHALLQVARAARLLGAQMMLVGISAEIAQTMVQLDVDMSGLHTYADLQSGIAAAFAQQGLAIVARSIKLPSDP